MQRFMFLASLVFTAIVVVNGKFLGKKSYILLYLLLKESYIIMIPFIIWGVCGPRICNNFVMTSEQLLSWVGLEANKRFGS